MCLLRLALTRGLQTRWLFLDLEIGLVACAWFVDEIECHCRSLKPFSTITNRPNGIGFRKFPHGFALLLVVMEWRDKTDK